MPFDKRRYQREYMRKRRAVDPSYGQPSSTNGYEEEEEYDEEEEYELPQISIKALIVIAVAIGLGLLFAWIYFKFFRKSEPEEKEFVI